MCCCIGVRGCGCIVGCLMQLLGRLGRLCRAYRSGCGCRMQRTMLLNGHMLLLGLQMVWLSI